MRTSEMSLRIAELNKFDQQDDNGEALQYNGDDIPKEYLAAKLAFTRDHEDQYRSYKKGHEIKDEDRRNTGFHFNKADIYNETSNSFN